MIDIRKNQIPIRKQASASSCCFSIGKSSKLIGVGGLNGGVLGSTGNAASVASFFLSLASILGKLSGIGCPGFQPALRSILSSAGVSLIVLVSINCPGGIGKLPIKPGNGTERTEAIKLAKEQEIYEAGPEFIAKQSIGSIPGADPSINYALAAAMNKSEDAGDEVPAEIPDDMKTVDEQEIKAIAYF